MGDYGGVVGEYEMGCVGECEVQGVGYGAVLGVYDGGGAAGREDEQENEEEGHAVYRVERGTRRDVSMEGWSHEGWESVGTASSR